LKMFVNETIENIVINLAGRVRRERVGKRDYVVAPLTMIVPGVLNGSHGPILYPAKEVAASATDWEGVILTDGHPPDWADDDYQDEYGIGYVHNPTIQNGKLKAEGWFDVERTRRVNPQILNAVLNGHTIELSTGVRMDFDSKPGIHNGRYYEHVGRSYRPDHLAILIHERGACSVMDGCGVNNCDCDGHRTIANHEPAGGQLGLPIQDWSQSTTAAQRPAIIRSDGGLPVIDWNAGNGPSRLPQQPGGGREYQGGPAGGQLGGSPGLFD
jgi:hypothetical protein